MAKVFGIVGWILAAGATISAVYLYGINRRLSARLDRSLIEQSEILERVEQQAERGRSLAETIDRLSGELGRTQAAVDAMAEQARELEAALPSSRPTDASEAEAREESPGK